MTEESGAATGAEEAVSPQPTAGAAAAAAAAEAAVDDLTLEQHQ